MDDRLLGKARSEGKKQKYILSQVELVSYAAGEALRDNNKLRLRRRLRSNLTFVVILQIQV